MNVVSAVSYSASDIVTIFETTKNISLSNLFEASLIVIIMYTVLIIIFIMGLIWFSYNEYIFHH